MERIDVFNDKRIVLTLDAGGTNFVFSALQKGEEIVNPITLPSNCDDLEKCLKVIIEGFEQVNAAIAPQRAEAISFAFPGPSDYKKGIIGDLINLPCFRGGVALGPMLEEIFGIPTYINNDGDLFTYGEAIAGMLPTLNSDLKDNGADKEYRNLFGITLGTGYGGGIVSNQRLFEGDNSAAAEIWLMRDFKNTNLLVEESVSIRAVQRVYKDLSGDAETRSPQEIYFIATGQSNGDKQAAIAAFEEMAHMIGESLANAITLIDGAIVVGGGISGASELIIPTIVEHLNGHIENLKGDKIPRLVSKVYSMEDEASYNDFLNWESHVVKVPFSDKEISYHTEKKLIVGLSRLGTSRAVCLGAYAYALAMLDDAKEGVDNTKVLKLNNTL
ncbi:ROK family protein [Flavobacterium psychrotrophum]|uniref:ROK family protein n=1 Tax=Flavobacterium psychrotrophum TaxID=2294119 RepID=UPI00196903D2|nr:ROK family protein [Flavobacterium psychrotrophum]